MNASASQFHHVRVDGGSISNHRLIDYPGQFNIHDVTSFVLSDCLISSNQIGDDALHVAYSQGEITNCRFENAAFDALDMDISEVLVSDSKFIRSGNDALDLMASNISVQNILVDGAGDKCISVGEGSDLSIKNSKLQRCEIGMAVKDLSQAYVENTYFNEFRDIAISLYQKNPRYGSGGTISGKELYGITSNDVRLDGESQSLLTDEAYISSSKFNQ